MNNDELENHYIAHTIDNEEQVIHLYNAIKAALKRTEYDISENAILDARRILESALEWLP